MIGGVAADVQFEGLAPNAVSGLLQVNVTIPRGAPSGPAVLIMFQASDWQSPTGATIAVQQAMPVGRPDPGRTVAVSVTVPSFGGCQLPAYNKYLDVEVGLLE
jgi:hypothetical protein